MSLRALKGRSNLIQLAVIARSLATRQSSVASEARQSPPFMRLLRPQGARNDKVTVLLAMTIL
jgi:hypothetical protein